MILNLLKVSTDWTGAIFETSSMLKIKLVVFTNIFDNTTKIK